MDLLALADFNLVATHGGFGAAGRAARRPKATLSRRVAQLEQSLGVRLFERGGRSLRLTGEGRALHTRVEALLAELADASEAAGAGGAVPHGTLRVSAPLVFAHAALGGIAARFAAEYPQVRLEVVAEDRLVSPADDGYDLVIRVNPSPDDQLVGRCFLHDERLLVAPPDMAVPEGGAERALRAVVLPALPSDARWRLRDDPSVAFRPEPVLKLSSLMLVRDAVLAGAGAALLPEMIVSADVVAGRLACWGAVQGGRTDLWALHASRRLISPKVKAFIQYLHEMGRQVGTARPCAIEE